MSQGEETPHRLVPDPDTSKPPTDTEVTKPRENQELVKNLRKTVDQTNVNMRCVYMTVLVSCVFIIILLLVYSTNSLYLVGMALRASLEKQSWSGNKEDTFLNITTIPEVDKYIRHVFFPELAGNLMLLHSDYLLGVRMNLKRARPANNTLDKYKDEFPRVWDETKFRYNEKNEGELTERYAIWDYTEKESYAQAGAYTSLMLVNTYWPETLLDFATYQWRIMRLYWLVEQTTSIVIELLMHNSHLKATVYYCQVFQMSATGKISTQSQLSGTFPELLGTGNSLVTWMYILGLVLLLECLVRIYIAIKLIIRCVIVALKERRNDMEYYEFLGLTALIFEIVAIILFGTTLLKYVSDLQIPIYTTEDFDGLVRQVVEFRDFVRISAVCIILIILRAILILKNEFPSFGILFDTIINARADLIYFGFISFMLLLSFAVASYQLFGLNTAHFGTLQDCLLTLILMALGVTNLSELLDSHSPLASIFFLLFALLFSFVIVNMFLAVVMTTYTELRRRNQMFIVAKASILGKEAKAMQSRWLNFLLCRRPKGTAIELAKKYAALKEDQGMDATDRERLMTDLRLTMMQQQSPSLQDTLKYNMSQLDVFQSIMAVQERNLKTREQYIEELINEINLIQQQDRGRREKQLKLESNKAYIYAMIKDMVLYTCFIVLFVTMVYYKSQVQDKFLVEESLRRWFLDPEITTSNGYPIQFPYVSTPDQAYDWVEQVLIPLLYQSGGFMHGKLIGNQVIRETVLFAKPTANEYSGTNDIFPYIRDKEAAAQKPLEEFGTEDRRSSFESTFMPGFYYHYNATRSFRGFGGYVVYWDQDYREAEKLKQAIRTDELLGNFSKALIFDFALYSGDTQLVALCAVGLMKTEAGSIVPQIMTRSFALDLYTSSNTYLPALEIIYILFTLYYFYKVVREWLISFQEEQSEWRSSRAEKQLLQEVMDEIQGIEMTSKTGSEECLHHFKRIVEYWVEAVNMLCMSVLRYLKKDIFNVLDVVSLALSVVMLVYMGKLLFSDFRRDFSLPADMAKENLPELWTLSDYDLGYRTVSAINCLIIFLRMLKNFRFSKRLSILTEVLGSAALDIIFFLAMFAMILVAYALMANVLLGHENSDYRNLDNSFLSIYFLLLKDIPAYSYIHPDGTLGALLLISFLLIFNLFLLNMFIAIIVAHFYQVMEINKNVKHVELLTTLKAALLEYMNKAGAGRLKNCLERCLKRKENKEEKPKAQEEEEEHTPLESEAEDSASIDQVPVPSTSSNKWILALENKLWENSLQTISFIGLKSKMSTAENKNSLLTLHSDVASVAFLTQELWLAERSIKKKVYLWRQLTLLHEVAQIREQELQIVGRQPFSQKPLSVLQFALWQAASLELKLKLWTDHAGFNSQERACLWNCTLFSPLLFAKDPAEWDLAAQLSTEKELASLDLDSEIASVKPKMTEFLIAFAACQKRYEKFFSGTTGSPHSDLLAHFTETNDERMALWLSLSDLEKAMLFLNNPQDAEAAMLCHLLFECVNHHIIRLEILDTTMSDLLDAKIYDKHLRLAEWQAEHTILGQVEERVKAMEADGDSLSNYRFFLEKKKEAKLVQLEQKMKTLRELTEEKKEKAES